MRNKKIFILFLSCLLVVGFGFMTKCFGENTTTEMTEVSTIDTAIFNGKTESNIDDPQVIDIQDEETPLSTLKRGNATNIRNLNTTETNQIRTHLLNSVNTERKTKANNILVKRSEKLEITGNIRAKEITKKWSHTRPNGQSWTTILSENGMKYDGIHAGEDLAKISITAKSSYSQDFLKQVSDLLHKTLMSSQVHRTIILDKTYCEMGVGVYSEVKNGKVDIYITEHFKNAQPKQVSISKVSITGIPKSKAYTGKQIKPSITVKYNGKTLKNGTDYTISYGKNKAIGNGSIKITGKGNYTGSLTKSFKITKRNVSTLTYSKISNKSYTGKQIKPSITVKYSGKTLKKGTDYTVSYGKNKSTGKGTVKITGKGNYTGSITKTFYIVPKKVTISSAKSSAKKKITVKYKKVTGASGYQIAYQKSGSKKWTYTTVSSKSASKTLTKLTSKKNYKVKVRAYKTVSGKKYYGTYSATKTVKVK